MSIDPKQDTARQGRVAAVVIAATGVLWIGSTFAGSQLGWSHRTLALFDLAALAGFAWALIAIYRIWRARQNDEG
ncbi:DUF5337 domain-containing protein [Aliiroseovarius sp.]|uniref:DUF5337 domain-containing protein n=1 Tax=Aliiroseovarius sp. TaxID=1872442 RepID=UPI003BABFC5C